MRPSNHPGRIIPQDTGVADGADEVLTGLPFGLDEVNELLYGDDRPTGERMDRLRELADQLRERQAGDLAGNDPGSLLNEVDLAISALSAKLDRSEPGALDDDLLDHRETLSPDSDELEAIAEEDEDSITNDIGVLDEEEWVEDDAIDTSEGVH